MYNIYLYVLKVIMITDALILMLSLNLSNCHYMCWLNSSMSIYYILYSIYYIWLKGVPRRICLDYNDTFNKLFQKCFTNSASIVHRGHHSHVPTRANHCRAYVHDIPYNKQIYTCNGGSWTDETKRVRTESVPV